MAIAYFDPKIARGSEEQSIHLHSKEETPNHKKIKEMNHITVTL